MTGGRSLTANIALVKHNARSPPKSPWPLPNERRQRRGRKAETGPRAIHQLPWKQPQLTLEPSRILSDDQIEAIHRQSLKRAGGDRHGHALCRRHARFSPKAGASVTGERVRIGRDIIEEALKTPPAEFTFHARNPAHNHPGRRQVDRLCAGRRAAQLLRPRPGPAGPARWRTAGNFVKLSQFFNTVHTAGGASVDALDVHASIRHLHITRNKMVYSDKVPFVSSTGRAPAVRRDGDRPPGARH